MTLATTDETTTGTESSTTPGGTTESSSETTDWQYETTSGWWMRAAGPIGYYRVSARNLDARCMDDDCVCAQAGDNCACDGRLVDCESLY